MDIILDEIEIRIMGSLMEKSMATPDYYPLSLNALTNACNQKSNRDPVVFHDEATVEDGALGLMEKGLVHRSGLGRVPKYEESFSREKNLVADEMAVLCVLFLRGPQTAGEIRSRTNRLCRFENLDAVHKTLGTLSEWGYVTRLPRLPGHKEARFTHLFSGEPESTDLKAPAVTRPPSDESLARMENMEEEIQVLREELDQLKTAFQAFKDQFE